MVTCIHVTTTILNVHTYVVKSGPSSIFPRFLLFFLILLAQILPFCHTCHLIVTSCHPSPMTTFLAKPLVKILLNPFTLMYKFLACPCHSHLRSSAVLWRWSFAVHHSSSSPHPFVLHPHLLFVPQGYPGTHIHCTHTPQLTLSLLLLPLQHPHPMHSTHARIQMRPMGMSMPVSL